MSRSALACLVLILAGCAAPTAEESPTTTPTATVLDDPAPAKTAPRLGLNISDDGDWKKITAGSQLAQGEGMFVVWPFDGIRDRYSFTGSLTVSECAGALKAGPAILVLRPSVLTNVSDAWGFNEFEGSADSAYFDVWYGAKSIGFGAGGSSSESMYVGAAFAVVALQPLCFDATYQLDATMVAGQAPMVHAVAGKATAYVRRTEQREEVLTHEVSLAGWTHVQRTPQCQLPDAPFVEFPRDLVSAKASFPNGYDVNGGIYLNGIFPGPTLDDPEFFGTFSNVPGPLTIEVTSPAPEECLVVVETDLVMPSFGAGDTGYTDAHASVIP